MYRDAFGTDWDALTVETAIRRAFALGAASVFGERLDGELDRLREVTTVPSDRRMVDLAFDEGKARARGARDDGATTWQAVVGGDHRFASDLDDPAPSPRGDRVPDGVPEAVGRLPLLDRALPDDRERHRLPSFLDGRTRSDDEE